MSMVWGIKGGLLHGKWCDAMWYDIALVNWRNIHKRLPVFCLNFDYAGSLFFSLPVFGGKCIWGGKIS